MSRRSHLVQWTVTVAAVLLADILTARDHLASAVFWGFVALGAGFLIGTALGFALDEYRPPKPGFWRVGWRR